MKMDGPVFMLWGTHTALPFILGRYSSWCVSLLSLFLLMGGGVERDERRLTDCLLVSSRDDDDVG